MKLTAAYLSALVFVSASAGAAAGPIADAGQRAETLAAEGKTLEALAALDEAVDAIWEKSPLLFRSVRLVGSDDADGAAERSDRVFAPDDTLRVRVEPVGYGYGSGGSEAPAKIGFSGDLSVENATGQVLAEAKDLFSVFVDSAAGDRHFDMTLSFVVPYVRPGDYIARFTLRDQNSAKSGTFDVPFSVAVPGVAAQTPAGGTEATSMGTTDAPAAADPATAAPAQ